MTWRDKLVEHLTSSIRLESGATHGVLKLSMSWPSGDIDMPEVCNHLARRFKIPSVTVLRRTPPGRATLEGGRTAALRITCKTNEAAQEMLRAFCKDVRGLAMAIVSSGT
ncbi:MAG: hypothetical protein WC869_00170 [Phycisphaerae bacterium]|jgi:hypothetical protein